MELLFESIKNDFDILNFEDGWDDEGAKKVDRGVFIDTILFLFKILKELKHLNKIRFSISACGDETIDISDYLGRESEHIGFLINIGKERIGGYCINHNTKSELKFEQKTLFDKDPSRELINWLNENYF
jgi:hypothetical protein